jgi:hypothetical protein
VKGDDPKSTEKRESNVKAVRISKLNEDSAPDRRQGVSKKEKSDSKSKGILYQAAFSCR